MKLELKHLAPYLPYGLKIEHSTFQTGKRKISELTSIKSNSVETEHRIYCQIENCKPILRPISELLEKLDFFELGDDDNYSIEFDHGNIKLIKNLESIADNKSYFDIQFLPYAVVQQLIEWHFDIFGLIPAGLAISIHDVGQVIA